MNELDIPVIAAIEKSAYQFRGAKGFSATVCESAM